MRAGKDVAGFLEDDWGNGVGHDFVYEERQPEFFDWGYEGWMVCKRCGARKRVRSRLDQHGLLWGYICDSQPNIVNVNCLKGEHVDEDASNRRDGMAEAVNVSVELRGDALPGLEDSHFIYTQRLVGLTPNDRKVFSEISVSAVGITVTEVTSEEVKELVRLFRALAFSLENGVV